MNETLTLTVNPLPETMAAIMAAWKRETAPDGLAYGLNFEAWVCVKLYVPLRDKSYMSLPLEAP